MNQFLPLGLCLCLALVGCRESRRSVAGDAEVQSSPSPAPAVTGSRALEPCSLLTSEEIQAVQGEPVTETKPSSTSAGGIVTSQCFFSLPTWSNSVTLRILQRGDAAGSQAPEDLWRKTFSSETKLMQDPGGKKGTPRKIEALGDDAYWVGNDMIGALNVLKSGCYITISVGGPGDQAAKIEKCTALARIVVDRL